MTVIKSYCDHCGKEIEVMRDYDEIDIEVCAQWFKVDLCKECGEQLNKIVAEFCKKNCDLL